MKPRGTPAPSRRPRNRPPAVESELPQIEGIDIAGGLKRVAGNKRLYRSLLEQFAGKQAGVAAQIAEALGNGDRALAERLAHTVKGVAGNIGIGPVQTAAANVETRYQRGRRLGPGPVGGTGSGSGAAGGCYPSRAWRVRRRGGGMREFNAEAAAAAVARLMALIEDNDGDAADAVQTVADALAGKVDAQRLGELRDAIDEFDFDKAAQ